MKDNNGSIYDNSELKEDIRMLKEDNAKLKFQKRKETNRNFIFNSITSIFSMLLNATEDVNSIDDFIDDIFDD